MENKVKFTDEQINKLALKFKILSETSRLKILRSLFDGALPVKKIIVQTDLLQSNVSKQLKVLEQNGIVKCIPDGNQRIYQIVDDTIVLICELICQSNKTN